jgi:hypothetical protein
LCCTGPYRRFGGHAPGALAAPAQAATWPATPRRAGIAAFQQSAGNQLRKAIEIGVRHRREERKSDRKLIHDPLDIAGRKRRFRRRPRHARRFGRSRRR